MPSAIVVDASALVEIATGTAVGRQIDLALRGANLHAPDHLDAEVLSGLARSARADPEKVVRVPEWLRWVERAPIERHRTTRLLGSAWRLRHDVAMRDALYIVLAQVLEATVLTADRRLAGAPAKLLGVRIETL